MRSKWLRKQGKMRGSKGFGPNPTYPTFQMYRACCTLNSLFNVGLGES